MDARKRFVNAAVEWLGVTEQDAGFGEIIDTYNTLSPLPRGYKMRKSDAWCAAFVSACGIKAGLGDIILPECSCSKMIDLYKAQLRWMESDDYIPHSGDLILYDWQDSGNGDNVGAPDHVGIVVSVVGKTMTVIEGNKNEKVAYRTLEINGRYIRGYCLPDFARYEDGDAVDASLGKIIEGLIELRKILKTKEG